MDHIGPPCGFGEIVDFKAVFLGVIPIREKVPWPGSYDDIQPAISHTEGLRSALNAVAQNGYDLTFQYIQTDIFISINLI
jgi:hypothetical protein